MTRTLAGCLVTTVLLVMVNPMWAAPRANLTEQQKNEVLFNSYASDGQITLQCREVLNARPTNTPHIYLKKNSTDLIFVPNKVFLQCMNIYMDLFPENVKKLKERGVDLQEILK